MNAYYRQLLRVIYTHMCFYFIAVDSKMKQYSGHAKIILLQLASEESVSLYCVLVSMFIFISVAWIILTAVHSSHTISIA